MMPATESRKASVASQCPEWQVPIAWAGVRIIPGCPETLLCKRSLHQVGQLESTWWNPEGIRPELWDFVDHLVQSRGGAVQGQWVRKGREPNSLHLLVAKLRTVLGKSYTELSIMGKKLLLLAFLHMLVTCHIIRFWDCLSAHFTGGNLLNWHFEVSTHVQFSLGPISLQLPCDEDGLALSRLKTQWWWGCTPHHRASENLPDCPLCSGMVDSTGSAFRPGSQSPLSLTVSVVWSQSLTLSLIHFIRKVWMIKFRILYGRKWKRLHVQFLACECSTKKLWFFFNR
jgi:hypothetical protein